MDSFKSMVPDGIRPRIIFKELADVIAKSLVNFEQYWESGQISADWKLVNLVPIFKKGKKKDPRNYRPVSLTPVPGYVPDLWRRLLLEVLENT